MTSSRQPKATTPRKPVRRRASTKQPIQALAGLTDALDCFGEAFVLWDADDLLVLCNRRYREIFARTADAMVPGASFEQVLRCAVARGQYAETIADPEAWIQERLRRRREAAGSFAIQLARFRGARVTATASARNLAFVAGLGAEQVIDYRAVPFKEHDASWEAGSVQP